MSSIPVSIKWQADVLQVLISDTSIVIDLERGTFLEELFRLPFEFVVPDLLFQRELSGSLGDHLVALGLRVEELTSSEVARATTVWHHHGFLSVPDAFAFALAEARGWALLTGDGALRQLALAQRINIHGVLWLLDQFEAGQHVTAARLHAGLTTLATHPRCRLPAVEIRKRLARYVG